MDTGTRNYHVRTVTIKVVVDYCLQPMVNPWLIISERKKINGLPFFA
jgi:hypothetical protein